MKDGIPLALIIIIMARSYCVQLAVADYYGCLHVDRVAIVDIKFSFSSDQENIDPYSKFMP